MKANMSLEPIVSTTHHSQQDVDKCVDCPLCMEALDYDDIGFYPCGCGYQVCRFCWNRLKNDESGLCPACRQPYPDSPIQFSTISIEAVEELKKKKKKQKEKQKLKDVAKTQNLSSVRVVQKNLLFVIGLPQRLSQEDLRKEFSKYGKILKMVINQSSAYVTYSRPEDAVAAIKSLNESTGKSGQRSSAASTASNGQQQPLRASLGTTKYCTHWLRSQSCPKQPDCMYLHEMAEPEASFTKEEMQLGKHTEYEKRLIQHYLDLLAKEKAEKTNRKNAAKDADSNTTNAATGDKVQSKTITINNKTKQRHHKNNNNSHNHHNNTSAHNNHTNGSAGSNGFNGETNGFGDEYSNDSMANGESGDSNAGTAQLSSSSPVTQGWGTPTTQTTGGRAMVSSNNSSANSESNSLSSTPNQTPGAAQQSPQEALVHQLQHGVRLGQTQRILSQTYQKSAGGGGGGGASDLFNSIDDNAVDAQIMQTIATKTVDMDGDDSNDDITANDDDDDDDDDDDGLDFDPISISTRGLQDLLKDSSIMMTTGGMAANSGAGVIGHRQQPNHVFNNQLNSDHMYMSSAAHNLPMGPKPQQNSMQMPIQQMMANKSVADYQNSLLANNRHHMMNAFNNQQMSGPLPQQQHLTQHHIHSQQQQQPPPLWQTQQQNSLRQLLPNVNIAFRQQPNGAPGMDTNGGPNAFMNGFAGNLNTNNSSQQMIPNIRQQQQQSIAHQMGGQSMISGHPVMATTSAGVAANGGSNGVNVMPQFWTQSQQQQHQQQREHMFRLQQQQQHHQQQQQQQQHHQQIPMHRQHPLYQQQPQQQRLYMGPVGQQMPVPTAGARQPPPGF